MKKFEVKVNAREEVYMTVKAENAQHAIKILNDLLVANGRYPSACKAVEIK
jgi:hypothetical protein